MLKKQTNEWLIYLYGRLPILRQLYLKLQAQGYSGLKINIKLVSLLYSFVSMNSALILFPHTLLSCELEITFGSKVGTNEQKKKTIKVVDKNHLGKQWHKSKASDRWKILEQRWGILLG